VVLCPVGRLLLQVVVAAVVQNPARPRHIVGRTLPAIAAADRPVLVAEARHGHPLPPIDGVRRYLIRMHRAPVHPSPGFGCALRSRNRASVT